MNLQHNLTTLEAQGLVRPGVPLPDLHYLFRHALIQDAAYASLLKVQRKQLHLLVGEVLEQTTPQRAELAPLLAHHFMQAQAPQRALPYLIQAGDTAFARYANAEAAAHYEQALRLLQPTLTSPTALTPQVRQVFARRGRALEWLCAYAEALQHYAQMAELAQTLGDTELEFAAVSASAIIHSTTNALFDGTKAEQFLERARILAHLRQDAGAEAKVLWNLMLLNVVQTGALAKRQTYGEQALAVARAANLTEQMAFILTDLWYAYAGSGDWHRAQATLEEAVHLWQTLGNRPMHIEALGRLCAVAMCLGEYDAALTHGPQAYQLSCEIQHADAQALSRAFYPLVFWERGAVAQALSTLEDALGQAAKTQTVTILVGTQAELGLRYAHLGAVETGLPYTQRALQTAETIFPPLAAWPHAALARILLRAGDLPAAQKHLAQTGTMREVQTKLGFIVAMWAGVALAHAELALVQHQFDLARQHLHALITELETQHIRHLRAEAETLLGWVYSAQAEWVLAQAAFTRVHAVATELKATWRIWQAAGALAYVAHQQGAAATAHTWHQQAQAALAEVLAQMPTPQLRQSFTALPAVQAVLAPAPGQIPALFWVNAEKKQPTNREQM